MKNLLWIICSAGVLLSLNGNILQAHPRFDVTDLGPLSTASDQGYQPAVQYFSLNNAGQIVGVRLPNYDVFLWQNGQTTDLGVQGTPIKINDLGQVVINTGQASDTPISDSSTVLLWDHGTIIDLSQTLPDAALTALDFNNNGQILLKHRPHGDSTASTLQIWEKENITTLENVPEIETCADIHINNPGQVIFRSSVGKSGLFGGSNLTYTIFCWEDNQLSTLGELNAPSNPYVSLQANDSLQIIFGEVFWQNGNKINLDFQSSYLNNQGQIVGNFIWPSPTHSPYSFVPDILPIPTPVLWENGITRNIHELLDNKAYPLFVTTQAINDNGQILIEGYWTGDGITHGLLLSPNGQTDTNDPPAQGCSQYLIFLIGILALGFTWLGKDQ